MIHILIKDKISTETVEELVNRGFQVKESIDKPGALLEEVQDNEILIVRSATKVSKKIIDVAAQAGMLKLIIRAGVGLDNIAVNEAQKNGISVKNTPAASSLSVAELSLAHMFALARHLIPANLTLRNQQWNKKQYKGIELTGKILGIIGMGRIGQTLAEKADALGMTILYYDILGKRPVNPRWLSVSFEYLLTRADFISLHVPAVENGSFLVDETELKKMKKDAFLINIARGQVVNEKALIDALDQGEIAGAGIDVFCEEPCQNSRLLQHAKISVTPHIGASTLEAQSRIGQEILSIIDDYEQHTLSED